MFCIYVSLLQVSARAKKRGLPQLGTLGAGNHYCEIQVVDEIFDQQAAARMGIDKIGTCVNRFVPFCLFCLPDRFDAFVQCVDLRLSIMIANNIPF